MFNITMEHTYFSNGKLSGVDLVPTAETLKLPGNTRITTSRGRGSG